jgi:hypothetical protein
MRISELKASDEQGRLAVAHAFELIGGFSLRRGS